MKNAGQDPARSNAGAGDRSHQSGSGGSPAPFSERWALASASHQTWSARAALQLAAVRDRLHELRETGCTCCGRPWSARAIAARIIVDRRSWAGGRGPIAHTTLQRIMDGSTEYGRRVSPHLVSQIGKQLVELSW